MSGQIKNTSQCLGYQQITSLSASTALTVPTAANGQNPTAALIQCETQNVRWRDDGTAPSATVGMLIVAAGVPFLYDGDLTAIRFFEAAGSAKLNVAYYA